MNTNYHTFYSLVFSEDISSTKMYELPAQAYEAFQVFCHPHLSAFLIYLFTPIPLTPQNCAF